MKRWFGPASAVIVPIFGYLYIKYFSSADLFLEAPRGHFYVVSIVSLISVAIAVAVGVVGKRQRNIQITFLALSFLSLAEMFAVHGFATPGLLLGSNQLVGVSSELSVLLASVWLFLSSLPSDSFVVRALSSRQSWLVPVWAVGLGAAGLAALLFPHAVDFLPLNHHPLKGITVGVTLALCAGTIYRYLNAYRYSRFPLQIAIVYSACMFIVAQLIITMGGTWLLSWWLYHFALLAAVIVMVYGLMRQYGMNRSWGTALKALFTNDPVERVTNFLSSGVKALIVATETRDRYTGGHNMRVALYSLKLAEEMGLPPEQLRALTQGAIVHDVGKINVPDAILNKPGPLTEEEMEQIRQHPVRGYEMCKTLGFMLDELGVIRSHHERWDGTGYPDGLAGEEIPLLARIVAVADVYDALTSSRSYRDAWSHEAAIAYIRQNSGTQFDPRCVEAWLSICERHPDIHRYPAQFAVPQSVT